MMKTLGLRIFSRLLLAALALGALALAAAPLAAGETAAVGRPAPEFSASAWVNHAPISLADLRGKFAVVELWGSWCPPCKAMMPHLRALVDEYGDRVQFIGFAVERQNSANTKRKMRQWLETAREQGLELPVRDESDPRGYRVERTRVNIDWPIAISDQRLQSAYPGRGVPRAFLIDPEGIVAWTGHPAELAQVLPAALAGETENEPPVTPAPAEATAAVGRPAPELPVTDWVQGAPAPLAELRGESFAVVELWGTWCGACQAAMPHFKELADRYGDRARFIGLALERPDSADTPAKMRTWLENARTIGLSSREQIPGTDQWRLVRHPIDINWTIALGDVQQTLARYPVQGVPFALLVDREGVLVWAGHPNDLEAALDEHLPAPAGEADDPEGEAPAAD